MIATLERVLADSYALYLKAQNYHWNVVSSDFFELHKFFEVMYSDLAEAIDTVAELIRMVDVTYRIPATFATFQKNTILGDPVAAFSATEMVNDLKNDQLAICDTIAAAIKESQELHEYGVEDFLAQRFGAHKKFHWMLASMGHP